jgi:malate dehydrogenase
METKDSQPIRVAVTGAAGNIAYAFIPLLLTGQVFGDRHIDLRLLDLPMCADILKGVIMEINDCAYERLEKVSSGSDPKEMFKDADVIVFLGGFPRKPGMERKDLLHKNKNIFMEQGKALEVASPNVRCVVIANPANTNAHILQHYSNGKVPK